MYPNIIFILQENNNPSNVNNRTQELESTINLLRSQLQAEQSKNYTLSNENNILKQQISQLQFQLNQRNNVQSINNNNNRNNSVDSVVKLIREKEAIINDLNEKLKRYPFVLEKNEKIMSIIFSSINKKINYSLVCKNTDTIHKIEEQLYMVYPNLCEVENYFLCNGQLINKFQTFETNNIKNGDTIFINNNSSYGVF